MMTAGPSASVIPGIFDRLFPRATWYSATAVIGVIEVVAFLATLFVGEFKFDGAFVLGNAMFGPSGQTLRFMGARFGPDISMHYQVWRLLTCIFLHSGVMHIVSNMIFQMRFGFVLEIRWTLQNYLAIYLLTGIGSGLFSEVINPFDISVGASGALFGLMGADMAYLYFNWDNVPHKKMEFNIITLVVAVNILIGFMGSHIDNWAHIGGFINGFLVGGSLVPFLIEDPMESVKRRVCYFGWFFMWAMMLFIIFTRDLE